MKIATLAFIAAFGAAFASSAIAQLPSNPFNMSQNNGVMPYHDTNSTKDSVTKAPMYRDGTTGEDILPVDPWANARDRSGIETWRGSGQHGGLNYVGEATTYTDAQGQEMIAPEVNRHNMIVGLKHLRSLGYQIPNDYDDKVKNLPTAYGNKLSDSMNHVNSSPNPVSKIAKKMMQIFEEATGLNVDNILSTTMRLLGVD